MDPDFEAKFEAVNQLAKSIAELELQNHPILEQARNVHDQIATLKSKVERRFGGPVISDAALEKKIREARQELELRLKETRRARNTRLHLSRLPGTAKLQILKAMLTDFSKRKVERVTLEDIENWMARDARETEEQQLLNELGVGSVCVPSTQFFRTFIKGKPVQLFPTKAYESNNAPLPATFNVELWKEWLLDNEQQLLVGKPGRRSGK